MDLPVESLNFEEAFADLQAAVEELRGDALTLERSLDLYERGLALAGRCGTLLTVAELRVTQSPATPGHITRVGDEADDTWQLEGS